MSTKRLATRIEQAAESATLAIDAIAKSMIAGGVDVVSFAAGEPDFPTPGFIVDAAIEAARDPRNHRYTAAGGLPELRAAIAEVTKRDAGLEVTADQVVVTNGGKHAIYEVLMTLIDEGDEVLIPAPYWVSYPEVVKLAGGVPVAIPTGLSAGFKVTPEDVERYYTERTKMFIHVSPSNPTGATYTRAESEALAATLDRLGLFVMSDEIYQHLTYSGTGPGERATSLGEVASPSLIERMVLVNGVSKTFSMTGWRLGWSVAPADIAKGMVKLQSQLTSNVANVSQRAALAAVRADLGETAYMREAFFRRRIAIVSGLAGIPGFDVAWPDGAFYAFPSVAGVIGRRYHGSPVASSMSFAELLLSEARVAVVPGEAFDAPGYLRLSYALGDDRIVEGISRISEFVAKLEP